MRETWEETSADIAIDDLYIAINLPHINQVYLLFRARLLEATFGPTEESLEVALFDRNSVPWERMAFATVIPVSLRSTWRAKGGMASGVVTIGSAICLQRPRPYNPLLFAATHR